MPKPVDEKVFDLMDEAQDILEEALEMAEANNLEGQADAINAAIYTLSMP